MPLPIRRYPGCICRVLAITPAGVLCEARDRRGPVVARLVFPTELAEHRLSLAPGFEFGWRARASGARRVTARDLLVTARLDEIVPLEPAARARWRAMSRKGPVHLIEPSAARADRLADRKAHSDQWYAERLARLRDLARECGVEDRFCAIVANGTAAFSEPPTYAQILNATIHRAAAAERQVAQLRDELRDRERTIQKLQAACPQGPKGRKSRGSAAPGRPG